MEVRLIVTMQVDSDGKLTAEQSAQAAKQAVHYALEFADKNGFSHSFADRASVGFVDAEVEERDKCEKCKVEFSEDSINGGRCMNCGTLIMHTKRIIPVDGKEEYSRDVCGNCGEPIPEGRKDFCCDHCEKHYRGDPCPPDCKFCKDDNDYHDLRRHDSFGLNDGE